MNEEPRLVGAVGNWGGSPVGAGGGVELEHLNFFIQNDCQTHKQNTDQGPKKQGFIYK